MSDVITERKYSLILGVESYAVMHFATALGGIKGVRKKIEPLSHSRNTVKPDHSTFGP